MNRRVVVTGTGIISPVGNNVETFWKNILDGVCGIDFITSIPTEDLPVKIAGEIKAKFGLDVDKKKISVADIKSYGEYTAEVKFYNGIVAKLRIPGFLLL